MKLRSQKLLIPAVAAALILAACGPSPAPAPTMPPPEPTTAPPAATPAPPAEVDDLSRIRASGTLSVGVSADYPPYTFYNSDFQIDGFEPALIADLVERIGVKADLNDFAFDGLLAALQLGQVDAVIAALSVTPERRELVDFTNVYYIGADAVLGRANTSLIRSVTDLARRRVGVQRGSVYATYLQRNLVESGLSSPSDIFQYSDVNAAMRDLQDGKLDYVMLDRLPARTFAANSNNSLVVVAENLNPQRFAIAVRKGSNLRAALNDALVKAQNEGKVADLIEKYLGIARDEIEPVPPPEPEPTPTPVPPGPTPTPAPAPCVNGTRFVADLSVPDGTRFQPGQSFQKGWRLQNSGNCDWAASFFLGFAFGNTPAAQMSGQPTRVGRVVPPGQTTDINVNLVAPAQPGTYQGFWQMHDANGVPFGERVWVQIVVPGAPTPVPPPPPTPVPGISFSANPTVISQGQCTTFSWSVQGIQGVWFFPQDQPWQNYGVPGVSSQQACPQQTTTYFLRVQFNDGTVRQQQITITVNPAISGPVIERFTADPAQITLGQTVNIQWQVSGGVTRIAILRNGAAIWDGAPTTGSYNDVPQSAGSVTYAIQAFDAGGQAVQTSRTVIVGNPGAQPPVINAFRVEPALVTPGSCVLISWDAGGGTTLVRIYRNYITETELAIDGTKVQGSGLQDCLPPDATGQVGYRMLAFNAQGQSVSRDVVVTIAMPTPR